MSVHAVYKRTRVDGRIVEATDSRGRRVRSGWRVRYRNAAGKQCDGGTFPTKREAERAEASLTTDLHRGSYVDPRAGRTTLGAYAERWFEAQPWRQSTRSTAQSHLDNHIGPAFGDAELADITNTAIQKWVNDMAETLAPATVDAVYRRFVSILEGAVADRLIASSPAVRIRLPRKANGDSLTVLEWADVEALADAVRDRFRAGVWAMAAGGLRMSEALGLSLDEIDFLRGEIHVEHQLVTLAGIGPTLGPPKTGSSARSVPIPDELVTELAAHVERFGTISHEGRELLFANRDGRPIRRGVAGDMWHRAVSRAGIEVPARSGWHLLRHVYAVTLIDSGASVKVLQARLGHTSAVTTLDTYGGYFADADDDTRAALSAAMRGA